MTGLRAASLGVPFEPVVEVLDPDRLRDLDCR